MLIRLSMFAAAYAMLLIFAMPALSLLAYYAILLSADAA